LEAEAFTVVTAVHLRESVAAIAAFRPELVLLETLTPTASVVALCAGLRAAAPTPLVLLSGPCAERDAVDAFGAGVDSVIIEPVGQHELVARVRALLRRTPPPPDETFVVITVGPVVLDSARRELSVHGQQIRIPRREFDIAELLMRDVGRVVPRQRLVRELWGTVRDTKSLDVQVGRLRARLTAVEGRRRIVTVRGVGFRFLADDDPELELAADAAVTPADPSGSLLEIDLVEEPGTIPPPVDGRGPELLERSAST